MILYIYICEDYTYRYRMKKKSYVMLYLHMHVYIHDCLGNDRPEGDESENLKKLTLQSTPN